MEDVDTVYLGAFHRQTVIDAGGYDEVNLQWAAEDQELNFRLRRRGGRIVLDPAIRSQYFPRQTPTRRSSGNTTTMECARPRRMPNTRPCRTGGRSCPVRWSSSRGLDPVPVGSPPAVVGDVADRWRTPRSSRHRRPPEPATRCDATPGAMALAICHWGYGVGLWRGVIRILSGRTFDVARPSGMSDAVVGEARSDRKSA